MRKRHRLILTGGFTEEELRKVFGRRGIRLHFTLSENHEDGFQEGEICFNPKRIKPKTIIECLLQAATEKHNAALVAVENQGDCHDCQPKMAT